MALALPPQAREHRLEERAVRLAGRERSASACSPSVSRATSWTSLTPPASWTTVRRVLVGHEPGRVRVLARSAATGRGRSAPIAAAVDDRPVADLEEQRARLPHERDEERAREVPRLSPLGPRGRVADPRADALDPRQGRKASRPKASRTRLARRPAPRPGREDRLAREPRALGRALRGARAVGRDGHERSDPPRAGGAGPARPRRRRRAAAARRGRPGDGRGQRPPAAGRRPSDRRPPVGPLLRVLERDVVARRRARHALHRVREPLEEAPELEALRRSGSRTAIWRRISMSRPRRRRRRRRRPWRPRRPSPSRPRPPTRRSGRRP